MSKRLGGNRRKTRGKYQRTPKQKGKLSLRKYLTEYSVGDNVMIRQDPICKEGIVHARFMGKNGTIAKKRGDCYEVTIQDFNKKKTLIVHPVHMTKSR